MNKSSRCDWVNVRLVADARDFNYSIISGRRSPKMKGGCMTATSMTSMSCMLHTHAPEAESLWIHWTEVDGTWGVFWNIRC